MAVSCIERGTVLVRLWEYVPNATRAVCPTATTVCLGLRLGVVARALADLLERRCGVRRAVQLMVDDVFATAAAEKESALARLKADMVREPALGTSRGAVPPC